MVHLRLISTVVAEEGMDVPAANCVIRFDPMLNAVSFVQGRGRARQADSSFLVLRERADRDVATLEAAEKQQLKIVTDFDVSKSAATDTDALNAAQKNRERGARAVLDSAESPVAVLNLFSKKTKVDLRESYEKSPEGWCCRFVYESVLRKVEAEGTAGEKKGAKRAAALSLVSALREAVA